MADGSDGGPHGGGGHELIIVRRHEEEEHEHHSSAWKVAHADFMTAMMAFFLIMWLINVTDDQVRKGISEYFNPIHMSQGSSDLKGLNKPTPGDEGKAAAKGHNDIPLPGEAMNLLKLSAGHADAKTVSTEEAAAALQAAAEAAARLGGAASEGDKGKSGEDKGDQSGVEAAAAAASANGDHAAFADPYAALQKIAEAYAAKKAATGSAIDGDTRPEGVAGGVVDRDPFDPAYWQLAPLPEARTDNPGAAGSAEAPPAGAAPDAAAASPRNAADTQEMPKAPEAGAEKPADAVAKAEEPGPAPAVAPATTVAETKAVGDAIAQSVKGILADGNHPDIAVAATAEGITINLTDDARYSMFPVGSAVPDAKTIVLLAEIAKVLSARPGEIVVRGYTDGRPFHNADYDNWRLSAARAHMAYYMLTRGGLAETRVAAIEGHADRGLKNTADPYAAENRRIEILLREKP